jgi:glycosyltransferase involved in cell wall biosynthesis
MTDPQPSTLNPQPVVSVVIPAYNEELLVGATVRALCDLPGIAEIVVVDDGSTDRTAQAAEEAGARVVRSGTNRGKGAALAAGIETARGGILLLLDADLGDSAGQAACLLEPVRTGRADMTIAAFPVVPGKGGGFGFVVRLARWGIRRAAGREMAAPLSGQRAVRREVIERVGGFAPGFGAEVALTIDALRAGFRVEEVPTTMTHRVTGRDWKGFRHRARQFLAVARALWARRAGGPGAQS